jgi:hypothetical protein
MTRYQISLYEKMRGVQKTSKIAREETRDEINRQQRRRKGEIGHGAGAMTTNRRKGRFSAGDGKNKRWKTGGGEDRTPKGRRNSDPDNTVE